MPRKRSPSAGRTVDEIGSRFEEYQQLIGRMQRAIDQHIPVGSTVLVASKGDPALLALGERTGWHFPRAGDGQYAGFHPANSDDAISRLDVLRQLGARYLVIPSTSAWWLDHYSGFIAHVRSCGRTLLDDPSVASIFELNAITTPVSPSVIADAMPRQSTEQLINLLLAVLPATATIAVIATKDDELVTHSPLRAIALRHTGDAGIDVQAAISELRELASGAADFLVVPVSSREWLDMQPTLAGHIDESYSLVTDQRNVCRIYDLKLRAGGVS
jgi:hypothetical protein